MSNLNDIAAKLVAYCKEGRNLDAINELYCDDVVSVEAFGDEKMPRELAGKKAVIGKGTWWAENHEVHSAEVKGPFPHGDDKFAVTFNYDITQKASGKRMQMEEVAIYTVGDGKIVREEFYYGMG